MKYGYARVSTDDQKADLQIAALKKAGCRHIFTDQGVSGTASKRPELTRCLESLRAGDTLIVWKLDRLGRSLSHLVAVLGELQGKRVAFKSLTEAIDTESAAGRLLGHILAALAEFERALIVERTQAGLKAAKYVGALGQQRWAAHPSESPVAHPFQQPMWRSVPEQSGYEHISVNDHPHAFLAPRVPLRLRH